MKINLLILCLLIFTTTVFGADLRGRMGLGASNQLANELPAVSFKIQRSKTFALGGLFGFKSDQDNTLYGAGVKFYRIVFDEPQLNFYLSGLFATQNYLNSENEVNSGYQVDATMGSEFHFTGLESIGFSFEFGASARDINSEKGASFQTLADHLIKAAVHFYL